MTALASDGAGFGVPVEISRLGMVYERGGLSTSVLRGISLAVPAGQFLCVMGPSGSGKSTLLHLLAGLLRPTAGEIVIGGRRVNNFSQDESARWRRRHVGLVHQFFNLVPTLTVVQNIGLPLLFDGKRPRELLGDILPLMERLGVEHRRNHALHELSGGELQRVAIARALLPQPGLLLADEPTGNLDSVTGHEVLSLLREVCSERNVTTLLMTHDLQSVKYADRLVLLRDGQIAQDDGVDTASSC